LVRDDNAELEELVEAVAGVRGHLDVIETLVKEYGE